MKDIKKEPKDVQVLYASSIEILNDMIKIIIRDKKSVHLNQCLNFIANQFEVDPCKFKKFIKTFSGNKYVDRIYILGEKCSKARFYYIKKRALSKLKANVRLRRTYIDYNYDNETDLYYNNRNDISNDLYM